MKNEDAINFWRKMAVNNPDEKTIKVNACNDYTQIDADFIMRYANKDSKILDLASGTGLTINKYCDKVKYIEGIELIKEFSSFIKKTSNIKVVNTDIKEYHTNKKFDIITMFGIVQYFNEQEIISIYRKYYEYIKNDGLLIIKTQFGIYDDITVSGYSIELKTDYYSHYRKLNKEMEILQNVGYKNIDFFDIYPPECNRWENTHFYAIVANK